MMNDNYSRRRVDPSTAERVAAASTPDEVRAAVDGIEDERARLALIAMKAKCFDQALFDELCMSEFANVLAINPAFTDPRLIDELAAWASQCIISEVGAWSNHISTMEGLFTTGKLDRDGRYASLLWNVLRERAPRKERRNASIAALLASLPELSREETLELASGISFHGFKRLLRGEHESVELWLTYLKGHVRESEAFTKVLDTPALLALPEIRRALSKQKGFRESSKMARLCVFSAGTEEFMSYWRGLAQSYPGTALETLQKAASFQKSGLLKEDLAPLLESSNAEIRLKAISMLGDLKVQDEPPPRALKRR